MAANLEFNVLCRELINIESFICEINNTHYCHMNIHKIYIMDHWCDTFDMRCIPIEEINQWLSSSKIVCVRLLIDEFSSAGIFIEKSSDHNYKYNFWIDSENYPALDSDSINYENNKYYTIFYKLISKLISNNIIQSFQFISIGIETELQDGEDILEIIKGSEFINVWIFNETFKFREVSELKSFIEVKLDDFNGIILENQS